MRAGLFGTDGVRGVANADLTPELAFRLGRAAAAVLARSGAGEAGRPRLLIGKDTRASGDVLEAALAAGAASAGVDAVLLGVVTTPGVAHLVRSTGAQGGAVISASHNPAEYNGVKFFSASGFKFPDAVEEEMEALALAADDGLPRPTAGGLGRIRPHPELVESYVAHVAATAGGRLDGWRLVLDCGHGAAYRIAPEVFRRLGAEVIVLNDRPDGVNINAGCGSLHPEGLQAAVVRERAQAGLAFDGDADRVIAVDEMGRVVDGDQILAIAGTELARRGRLPRRTVVATVMSNLGLEEALAEAGVRLVRTKVGDRHVLEAMLEGGYALGGEQSGHVIFLEHATTGDGVLTAVQLLDMVRQAGQPLSALAARMPRYPQVLVNVPAAGRARLDESAAVRAALARAEAALAGRGRVLVRPSGTEPLVRVMVEGRDPEQVEGLAAELAGVIARELN